MSPKGGDAAQERAKEAEMEADKLRKEQEALDARQFDKSERRAGAGAGFNFFVRAEQGGDPQLKSKTGAT